MTNPHYRLYFEKRNHKFSQSKGLLLPDVIFPISPDTDDVIRNLPIYIAPIPLVNTSTQKKKPRKIEISMVLDWNKYEIEKQVGRGTKYNTILTGAVSRDPKVIKQDTNISHR